MTRWLRAFAAAVCLCLAASFAANAEIDDWARAQEAAVAQMAWAELFGAEIDASETARNITKKCKIRVSEGDKGKLTNGRVGSPWRFEHSDAWLAVEIPDEYTAGTLRVEWLFDPVGFELVEYDDSSNVLRTRTQADTFPSIYNLFPLLPETRTVRLNMKSKDQSVSNLVVYSAGVLPSDVQTWLPPVEKADMMVFSTHQDDEVIFLGGTIPYADVVCGRPTVTVYMTNCSRERRREALEGLWEMGCRHYPEFINLEDDKVSSVEKGVKLWGGSENILKEMVARIRRYKPEVIVTQDLDGEYGHNQHKIMARAMQPAIEAAADPDRFPESFQQYGAWQVKKLYLHLYKENQIRMDWTSPQPACGGLSLLQVAKNGFEKHASQTKYYAVKDGGEYDNALFGLALSTVGEDVQKNDFFENIPDEVSEEPAPTTAPTDEPTAEPSVEATEAPPWDDRPEETGEAPVTADFMPSVTAAAPQASAPAETPRRGRGGLIAGLIAGVAALGCGAWALTRKSPKKKRKRRKTAKKAGKGRHSTQTAGRHQAKLTGKSQH